MGMYLLFKSGFLVLNSIDVSKFVLISMFKLLRSLKKSSWGSFNYC